MLPACLIWLAAISLAPTPSTAESLDKYRDVDWRLISNRDGIQVYEWEDPHSEVVAFKAVGEIQAELMRVASVITDITRYSEWGPNVEQAKTVRNGGPRDRIDYIRIGTPFIIKDRDFVLKGHADFSQAPQEFKIQVASVDDPDAPATDYVRGVMHAGHFHLISDPDRALTKITYYAHIDPMGTVPKWLVNMFQRDYPRMMMKSLRRQVTRQDLKIDPQLLQAYGPAAWSKTTAKFK